MTDTAETNSSSKLKTFLAFIGGAALLTLFGWVCYSLGCRSQKGKNSQEKLVEGNPKPEFPLAVVTESPSTAVPSKVISLKPDTASAVRPVPEDLELFRHSDDFRVIYVKNFKFELTTNEGRVIEKLYRAKESRIPEVSQSKLLEDLGICSKRLRDVFKGNPKAYKVLIGKSQQRKDLYYLKIG